MTKVGQMIWEEGWKKGWEEGWEEGWKKGWEEVKKEERITAIVNMLEFDIPEQKILENYTEEELNAAKKSIGTKQ